MSAYIQRLAELRNTDASLEADAWKSVELGAKLQKRPYNPESRNARKMPEMLRRHGVVEALIPTPVDQNPCAQSRSPMDMMRQG
jgi:hypothetical protein